MNWLKISLCGATLILTLGTAARAQGTVDMKNFTCQQLLSASANSIEAAIWLSGYYNGLRKNTVLNLDQFGKNAETVVAQCKVNPKNTVMDTVNSMMAPSTKK